MDLRRKLQLNHLHDLSKILPDACHEVLGSCCNSFFCPNAKKTLTNLKFGHDLVIFSQALLKRSCRNCFSTKFGQIS